MQTFLKAAESGEAKEHLKKKLAEGAQFDFDAGKLINGAMTEEDWQNLYTLQKQAWPKAVVESARAGFPYLFSPSCTFLWLIFFVVSLK